MTESKAGDDDCYHCDIKGYFKRDCMKLKKEHVKNDNRKYEAKENIATTAEGDLIYIVADVGSCLCVASQDTDWIVDTGASYHATPQRISLHRIGVVTSIL